MFVDISEKKITVVGGGNIAARRVKTLTDFCDHITVVSPEIHPELERLEQEGKIMVIRRPYQREDIYDAWMVLAATDDHKLNDEIYKHRKISFILHTAFPVLPHILRTHPFPAHHGVRKSFSSPLFLRLYR